jgi:DUF1707 SHOCT-like domain
MEAGDMDIPARGFPRGAIRVSDAERDAAVAELSQHYQAGRLTAEEFSERSGQAFEAKTGDQLHALFDDLPSPTPALPARVTQPAPPVPQPRRRLGPGRTVALVIVGYLLVGNVIGAVAGGNWDIGSILGALVPAAVFGAIFLAILRPVLPLRPR